jgi:putrescine---pyruvate transaminase
MGLPAFLHPFASPASTSFVQIVRGEGATVWDDAGNAFVDALASLWYCNVGHGRREIAEAVFDQMQTLAGFHTFDRFTNGPADELAETLSALAPMPSARVFLTSSGSEAVDSGIKLARQAHVRAGHPERTLVIGRTHAYHGVTYGGLSAQGLPLNQEGFGPLLGDTTTVDHEDLEQVAGVLRANGDRVAVVLAEPVIGAGGVRPAPPGYLTGLRQLCDEIGAFLLVDEVICGFGRLGGWWGSTRDGVTPDLVTFAKGVTSGYLPLGGVLVGPAVREPLEADPSFLLRHGHTYSGHPAAAVAALANIAVLREESLLDRADPIGDRLGGGLAEMADAGILAGVRGTGAIWAAVLHAGTDLGAVRQGMLDRGVIARPLGVDTIAFCPPLVVTDDQLDRCVNALRESIQDHPARA